jgi:hypothetical protein
MDAQCNHSLLTCFIHDLRPDLKNKGQLSDSHLKECALNMFRRFIRRGLRTRNLMEVAKHGTYVLNPRANSAAMTENLELLDMKATMNTICCKHEMGNALEIPDDVSRLREKQRITEEVMRELKMERDLQLRLIGAQARAMQTIKLANGKPGILPRSTVVNKPQISSGSMSSSLTPSNPDDTVVVPKEVSHGHNDPLLLASFARRATREWIPMEKIHQARYLTGANKENAKVSGLRGLAAIKCQQGNLSQILTEVETEVTPVIQDVETFQHQKQEQAKTFWELGPTQLTQPGPRGGMAFEIMSMVRWVSENTIGSDQFTGRDLGTLPF